jgi:hypothetical protein
MKADLLELLWWPHEPYRVRVEVDATGEQLRVYWRARLLTTLRLERDTRRIASPLRAICPRCDRLVWKLYLEHGWFGCGRCRRVTYSAGQGEERDRVFARLARLEQRLVGAEQMPRHRGRRKIVANLQRQEASRSGCIPARVLRRFARAS